MRKFIQSLVPKEQHHLLEKIGVYKITNIVSNKIYIGSVDVTTRKGLKNKRHFLKRFKEHIWDLQGNRHNNRHFQAAWNKNPLSSWRFEILEVTSNTLEREQYYLDTLLNAQDYINSRGKDRYFLEYGYNLCPLATSSMTFGGKCKKVYQFTLGGFFVKEWDCITDAAIAINDVTANICRACRKGETCQKFRWSYFSEYEFKNPKNVVYLFDNIGNFLKTFYCYDQCLEYFYNNYNIILDRHMIAKCCRKATMVYNDFIFSSSKELDMYYLKNNAVVFKDGEFLEVLKYLKDFHNLIDQTIAGWCADKIYGSKKYKNYHIFRRINNTFKFNLDDYRKYYETRINKTV